MRKQGVDGSAVALVVAAVVVFAFAGWVILRPVEPSSGGASSLLPADEPTVEPIIHVAFVGDSYTGGAGTDSATPEESRAEGYAGLAADRLGVDVTIDGQGGTGYLNPGQPAEDESPYLPRLRRVPDDADVIVVQGGGNDVVMPDYATRLPAAVDEVLTRLGAEHPDAELVVLGPVMPPAKNGPQPGQLATVVGILSGAAEDAGATFVDARTWLPTRDLYIRDLIHPNPEGHDLMAERLAGPLGSVVERVTP